MRLQIGETEAFQAAVFKNEEGRLECTLVAFHGEGYAEPWLIVTDLQAAVAKASWYGLRGWIEQGYKRVKGEGWKLPRTRIRDCQRNGGRTTAAGRSILSWSTARCRVASRRGLVRPCTKKPFTTTPASFSPGP